MRPAKFSKLTSSYLLINNEAQQYLFMNKIFCGIEDVKGIVQDLIGHPHKKERPRETAPIPPPRRPPPPLMELICQLYILIAAQILFMSIKIGLSFLSG